MLIDHFLEFAAHKDVADGKTDELVGTVVDTNAARGIGDMTSLVFTLQAVGAGVGAGTLKLQTNSAASGGTWETIFTVTATPLKGKWIFRLPVGLKQYLRVAATTVATTGAIKDVSASIQFDGDHNVAYPSPKQNFPQ